MSDIATFLQKKPSVADILLFVDQEATRIAAERRKQQAEAKQ